MENRGLWVIGNAVQDITVELDLVQLTNSNPNLHEMMSLGRSLRMKKGQKIQTKWGTTIFEFQMRLKPEPVSNGNSIANGEKLEMYGGEKYTLDNAIVSGPFNGSEAVSIHCEDVSWGGGGLNVIKFVRSICSNRDTLPLFYTDIAMTESVEDLFNSEEDPLDIPELIAKYSGENFLEVYLAGMQVRAHLVSDAAPYSRRNIAISRVSGSTRQLNDKIILRGDTPKNQIGEENKVIEQLNEVRLTNRIGGVVVNSLKDERMFNAAYEVYKRAARSDREFVGVFAITKSMIPICGSLIDDIHNPEIGLENHNSDSKLKNIRLPILIFNEGEFFEFAKKVNDSIDIEPFMLDADAIPNVEKFAQIVNAAFGDLGGKYFPRIYVTLGPRGSFGIDEGGQILHVAPYNKARATIFDTNACGDAYCGMVASLEWAKTNLTPPVESISDPDEMIQFMAAAGATAYAKATNRLGRVDLRDVSELLRSQYIASDKIGNAMNVESLKLNDDGTMTNPKTAEQVGIFELLGRISS